jgi:chaperone modulatory protein CbpM
MIDIDDNGSSLSLHEICERCGVSAALLRDLVDLGVVDQQQGRAEQWQFTVTQYLRIRRAVTLHRDLGINESGIALAMELLDEIARMKDEIQHLQRHIPFDE